MTDNAAFDDALQIELHAIEASTRVLANRVTELEAEVARHVAVTERLRQRLAAETAGHLAATAALRDATRTADAAEAELRALRATKLFRWSMLPRDLYRWTRLVRKAAS